MMNFFLCRWHCEGEGADDRPRTRRKRFWYFQQWVSNQTTGFGITAISFKRFEEQEVRNSTFLFSHFLRTQLAFVIESYS